MQSIISKSTTFAYTKQKSIFQCLRLLNSPPNMEISLSGRSYVRSYQAVQQPNIIFQFFIRLFQVSKQNLAKIDS